MMEKFFLAIGIIVIIVLFAWVEVNLFLIALRLWPLWLTILVIGIFAGVFSDKN